MTTSVALPARLASLRGNCARGRGLLPAARHCGVSARGSTRAASCGRASRALRERDLPRPPTPRGSSASHRTPSKGRTSCASSLRSSLRQTVGVRGLDGPRARPRAGTNATPQRAPFPMRPRRAASCRRMASRLIARPRPAPERRPQHPRRRRPQHPRRRRLQRVARQRVAMHRHSCRMVPPARLLRTSQSGSGDGRVVSAAMPC